MLKYVSKFVLEVLPSIAATVIGAYIVNHYVTAKSVLNAPAAAIASIVQPSASGPKAVQDKSEAAVKSETKPDGKSAEKSSAEAAKPTAVSIRSAPEKVATHDTERDVNVNDLARAAIERLRLSSPARAAEPAARPREIHRAVAVAPAPAEPAVVQPLPPAVTVSTPAAELARGGDDGDGQSAMNAREGSDMAAGNSDRLIPPAEIPVSRLFGLSRDRPSHTSVADDMLTAAKSVFHAVLPH